jgi:hypothetical protein
MIVLRRPAHRQPCPHFMRPRYRTITSLVRLEHWGVQRVHRKTDRWFVLICSPSLRSALSIQFGLCKTASRRRHEVGHASLPGHEPPRRSERGRMNANTKTFGSPSGGDEHHQTYASTNVRKTLDTTMGWVALQGLVRLVHKLRTRTAAWRKQPFAYPLQSQTTVPQIVPGYKSASRVFCANLSTLRLRTETIVTGFNNKPGGLVRRRVQKRSTFLSFRGNIRDQSCGVELSNLSATA